MTKGRDNSIGKTLHETREVNGQSPLQSNLECDEAEKHGVTYSDLIESGFDSGTRPLPAIRGVEPPSTNRPEALIISRFPQEIPVILIPSNKSEKHKQMED